MACRVQIDQISKTGVLHGRLALYEADTKLETSVLAAYEVDIGRSVPQEIATVFDPSSLLVLAYAGCGRAVAGDEGR